MSHLSASESRMILNVLIVAASASCVPCAQVVNEVNTGSWVILANSGAIRYKNVLVNKNALWC